MPNDQRQPSCGHIALAGEGSTFSDTLMNEGRLASALRWGGDNDNANGDIETGK